MRPAGRRTTSPASVPCATRPVRGSRPRSIMLPSVGTARDAMPGESRRTTSPASVPCATRLRPGSPLQSITLQWAATASAAMPAGGRQLIRPRNVPPAIARMHGSRRRSITALRVGIARAAMRVEGLQIISTVSAQSAIIPQAGSRPPSGTASPGRTTATRQRAPTAIPARPGSGLATRAITRAHWKSITWRSKSLPSPAAACSAIQPAARDRWPLLWGHLKTEDRETALASGPAGFPHHGKAGGRRLQPRLQLLLLPHQGEPVPGQQSACPTPCWSRTSASFSRRTGRLRSPSPGRAASRR